MDLNSITMSTFETIGIALLIIVIAAAVPVGRSMLRQSHGKLVWLLTTILWGFFSGALLIHIISIFRSESDTSGLSVLNVLLRVGLPVTILYGQIAAAVWFFSVGSSVAARLFFLAAVVFEVAGLRMVIQHGGQWPELPEILMEVTLLSAWLVSAICAVAFGRRAGTLQGISSTTTPSASPALEDPPLTQQDRLAALILWTVSSIGVGYLFGLGVWYRLLTNCGLLIAQN